MASNTGHLHNIQSLLEQPRGGLVAQVVEPKILDPGPANGADIGAFDGLGGKPWEDLSMQTAWQ
jgi:hypothetical protein